MNPCTYYQQQQGYCLKAKTRLSRFDHLSLTAKLVWLAAGLLAFFISRRLRPGPLIVWGVVFILIFILHERILRRVRRQDAYSRLFAAELAALDHKFPWADDGSDWAVTEHRYAADLNLFGPRSLFHYFNRCTTYFGRSRLASWLLDPAPAETVLARQQAVDFLAGRTDFRHRLRLAGEPLQHQRDHNDQWRTLVTAMPLLSSSWRTRLLLALLPLLTLTALFLIFSGATLAWGGSLVIVEILVNRFYAKRVSRFFALVDHGTAALETYREIIAAVEAEPGRGDILINLHHTFHTGDRPASALIAELSALCSWFQVRHNGLLHGLLNNIFLWDLQCVWRIQRWLANHGGQLESWLAALGEVEALCSLATLRFNHPDWSFPIMRNSGPRLDFNAVGHPLIPATERVCNDLVLAAGGAIILVTGPNMAGKSTFLRTIGINVVLAHAGAPICAARCALTPVHLVSSMQVADSLDRRLSLFYAELQRLKLILDGVRQGLPVLFMIDEILKGTNLSDRQAGALALLKQLIAAGAGGLVATHDMTLTGLEKEFPLQVSNYHFDGSVIDDRLLFDYQLHPGICHSHNAVALMRRIGIAI